MAVRSRPIGFQINMSFVVLAIKTDPITLNLSKSIKLLAVLAKGQI